MAGHRNVPLTPEGRLRLCLRIDGGRLIAHVAAEAGISRRCPGYTYLHTALDDHSRLACTEALEDGRAVTAAAFRYPDHPARVIRVRGPRCVLPSDYRSRGFALWDIQGSAYGARCSRLTQGRGRRFARAG